ncbi:MAG: hypothetical protein WC528_02150 [Patescibacteria group bacterium]
MEKGPRSFEWLGNDEKRFEENWPATREALLGVIKDCQLEEGVKEKLTQAVEDLDDHQTKWDNYIDAIEGTIRRIADMTAGLREGSDEKTKKEAAATFENLRDGLWDLFKKAREN